MHMLRQLLGDSSFFSAWREYGQEHAFGTAVTSDWQAKLEEYYGESLDWFFQPWVYGVRYPQYQVTLQISDITELTIEQTQTTGTRFRMPIDVQMISYSDDTVRFTLWNNATASQTWRIDSLGVHGSQRSMLIDPENKILKTATYRTVVAADDPPASLPTEFRISGIYPNPFNPTTTIRFDLPYSSAVHLNVFDLLGRRVSQLNLGTLSAGTHKTTWDGSNYPSGIYLFRLVTQQDSRTTKAVLLK